MGVERVVAGKARINRKSSRQNRLYQRACAAILSRMKFMVTLDRDEDGMWVAECHSIPGCVSQGKTRQEAMNNVREAIALCLEVRAERGMPLTVETSLVEVVV